MTGLLLFLALGMIVFALVNIFGQPPVPKRRHEFTANLKRGQIHSSIAFRYREGDTEFAFDAEGTINVWALQLDETEVSPGLYRALESELKKNGLARFDPQVIKMLMT